MVGLDVSFLAELLDESDRFAIGIFDQSVGWTSGLIELNSLLDGPLGYCIDHSV